MGENKADKKISMTFIERSGKKRIVSGSVGDSLMELARANDVVGIDGDCGGGCSCGTCCIVIQRASSMDLPEPDASELSILEFVSDDIVEGQRLGCQIPVTEVLEAAIIEVAT